MLGAWPDLPTVFAARDVAKEKMGVITTKTDDRSTGIKTLRDAMESHIAQSDASKDTQDYYRDQIDRHLSTLFDRTIDELTLPDLERALAPHVGKDGKPTSTQQPWLDEDGVVLEGRVTTDAGWSIDVQDMVGGGRARS